MGDGMLCDMRDIDSLYNAAFEGNFPKSLVTVIGSKVPKDVSIALFTNEAGKPGCSILLQSGPLPPTVMPGWNWGSKFWSTPLGSVYHDRDSADTSPDAKTFDCAVGVVIGRAQQRQTVLELRFTLRRNEQLRGRLVALLEDVAPHLQHALRILTLRCHDSQAVRMASGMLELLPFPTFLLDSDGVVQRLNSRATALVGRMDTLSMGADESLHAADPASDAALYEAISKISASHHKRADIIAIKKSGIKSRQFITIARLPTTELLANGSCAPGFDSRAMLVLIAQQCAEPLSISHDMLWHTFEMNSKEVDLALSLLNGESIGDYASRRHIPKQTLRNQLSGIMRKTDTSRQSELVGLLTRLALASTH